MVGASLPLCVRVDGVTLDLAQSGDEVMIGRDSQADVVVWDLRVSRWHLRLTRDPAGGWLATDAGSSRGTFHDGERVKRVSVRAGLQLRLGDPAGPSVWFVRGTAPVRITIGRDPGNDVVVSDLLVSRRHAAVERAGPDAPWILHDLSSVNGTVVEGKRVTAAQVADGDCFTVGRTALRLEGDTVTPDVPPPPSALECDDVVVRLKSGAVLLDRVRFTLARGQLLAVVGPTGSGKSTLLKTLTGNRPADGGMVLVEGQDLYRCAEGIRPMIGYVPQDDILHPQLTIRSALRYGAALRFPPDASAGELDHRVDEVMTELGLDQRADIRIDRLSGGQRKRTSVALELLTAPSLLFLDEPTSGLDPGYEKSVMQLLRHLADTGRTVVVVTHSVQSLHLADRVLFLAAGGRTAFFGPPGDALEFFGQQEYAEVFHQLEEDAEAFAATASPPRRGPVPARAASAPLPRDLARRVRRRQFRTLVERQLAVILADRRMLLYLLAAVLVPGGLLLSLVDRDALDVGGQLPSTQARTLVGALVVAAVAVGAANTLREVVKERSILARERAGGVRTEAYFMSKLAVFGTLTLVQSTLLVVIATAGAGGPTASSLVPWPMAELTIGVGLAALGAATLGLLLSTLVSSSEKAMALIPIVFVIQWLLSGIALDLDDRAVMRQIAYLTSANWGVAAVASTIDLAALELSCDADGPALPRGAGPATEHPEAQPDGPLTAASAGEGVAERFCDWRWQRGAGRWALNTVALLALASVPVVLAGAVLRRERP